MGLGHCLSFLLICLYKLQNEEVNLYYDRSEFWKSFPVAETIVVKYGWQNSRIVHATSQGLGKLSASLTCSSLQPGSKQTFTVVQEVMVCDQVKIKRDKQTTDSSAIVLPWAPGIYQEVKLETVGGCISTFSKFQILLIPFFSWCLNGILDFEFVGCANKPTDYKWFSSDMAIVSVSEAGICQAKQLGKATVKVVSVFDVLNFDEIMLVHSLKLYLAFE
ncbi:hypothetical protein Dimus_013682 [Dionaea muscipula]